MFVALPTYRFIKIKVMSVIGLVTHSDIFLILTYVVPISCPKLYTTMKSVRKFRHSRVLDIMYIDQLCRYIKVQFISIIDILTHIDKKKLKTPLHFHYLHFNNLNLINHMHSTNF